MHEDDIIEHVFVDQTRGSSLGSTSSRSRRIYQSPSKEGPFKEGRYRTGLCAPANSFRVVAVVHRLSGTKSEIEYQARPFRAALAELGMYFVLYTLAIP